jgi:hypothetical protein
VSESVDLHKGRRIQGSEMGSEKQAERRLNSEFITPGKECNYLAYVTRVKFCFVRIVPSSVSEMILYQSQMGRDL